MSVQFLDGLSSDSTVILVIYCISQLIHCPVETSRNMLVVEGWHHMITSSEGSWTMVPCWLCATVEARLGEKVYSQIFRWRKEFPCCSWAIWTLAQDFGRVHWIRTWNLRRKHRVWEDSVYSDFRSFDLNMSQIDTIFDKRTLPVHLCAAWVDRSSLGFSKMNQFRHKEDMRTHSPTHKWL